MSQQKTILNFRSKTYEVILDKGEISFFDKTVGNAPTRLSAGVKKQVVNLEKAKQKVQNFLMKRPDPGMTFSD